MMGLQSLSEVSGQFKTPNSKKLIRYFSLSQKVKSKSSNKEQNELLF